MPEPTWSQQMRWMEARAMEEARRAKIVREHDSRGPDDLYICRKALENDRRENAINAERREEEMAKNAEALARSGKQCHLDLVGCNCIQVPLL